MEVLTHKVEEPAGRGLGPLLETREALKVLEQQPDRPIDLEERALNLAGVLLELCLKDADKNIRETVHELYKTPRDWAADLLKRGIAHTKMMEIIEAQGGNPKVKSTDLKPGKFSYTVLSTESGTVHKIQSKNATLLCKILGAPAHKKAGIYLEKKIGETVRKGEKIYTLYSDSEHALDEAKESVKHFPVIIFES
jgi:AMP phosphorylase